MRGAVVSLVSFVLLCVAPVLPAQDIEECNEDLGIAIEDLLVALDTISVDDGPTVADVIVSVDITHTWQQDLELTLESGTGTVITLYDGEAGPKENEDIIVTWDDDGSSHGADEFNCACSMNPVDPLSTFDGEDSTGDWLLAVLDTGFEDTGTWNEWCLFIEECAVEPVTGLGCEVEDDAVTLTWKTNDPFDEVTVLRDGEEIASLGPDDDTSVTDEGVSFGAHQYEVIGNVDGESCEARARCSVFVGLVACDEPDATVSATEPVIAEIVIDDVTSIGEIEVRTEVSHTFYPDLFMSLVSPAGTQLILFNQALPDLLGDGIFIDWSDDGIVHASDDLACDCAMQPGFGELADFIGEPADGTWTLNVRDIADLDDGTLDLWCLRIDPCDVATPVVSCTLVDGDVELTWDVDKGYDTVSISRDGEFLGELSGDTDPLFIDEDPGQGAHVYEITGISDTEGCAAVARCNVLVGVFCDFEDSVLDADEAPLESKVLVELDGETSLTDVDVSLEITHTFYTDLSITLTSPESTEVALYEGLDPELIGPGIVLTFDDDGVAHASDDLFCSCIMAPAEALSVFNEEDPSGTWTLAVEDTVAGADSGTLHSWCLIPTVEEVEEETRYLRGDANGNGSFSQLGDPIFLLQAGFIEGAELPPCEDAADFNGDGSISFLGDGLFGLFATFVPDSTPIPAPHPDCDVGKILLGCETPPDCAGDP